VEWLVHESSQPPLGLQPRFRIVFASSLPCKTISEKCRCIHMESEVFCAATAVRLSAANKVLVGWTLKFDARHAETRSISSHQWNPSVINEATKRFNLSVPLKSRYV